MTLSIIMTLSNIVTLSNIMTLSIIVTLSNIMTLSKQSIHNILRLIWINYEIGISGDNCDYFVFDGDVSILHPSKNTLSRTKSYQLYLYDMLRSPDHNNPPIHNKKLPYLLYVK